MSQNPYPNIGNQPLLGYNQNQQYPHPPPPPQYQNAPIYNNNANFAQNQNNFNPNPPINNPSFQNNANPYQPNNPYNQGNNPYQQGNNVNFQNNQYHPNPSVNPHPGNIPNNPYNHVGSVGNYQVVRNNMPVNYAVNVICPMCRRETSSITRKVPGGVTWIWCFVLFIFTGCLCCVPFCVDSCQDTEMVCANCQTVKSRIQANCL